MSSSWAAPDPRPVVAEPPPYSRPPPVPQDPPLSRELLAGTLTALGLLVCAPAAGLLWAGLAPRVALDPDGSPRDPQTSAFIAADGVFLAVVLLLGIGTGLVAWRCSRRYGLGVVLGLAVGGLLAALLARAVGEAVGASAGDSFGERVGLPGAASAQGAGTEALGFRLRTLPALVGWPVGGLLAFLTAAVLSARARRTEPGPTSGHDRASGETDRASSQPGPASSAARSDSGGTEDRASSG